MRPNNGCFWLAAVVVLAGCAAPTTERTSVDDETLRREEARQRELALTDHVRAERRLRDVAWPVLRGAVPLCGDRVRFSAGLHYVTRKTLEGRFAKKEWRDAALAVYAVGKRPRVVGIVRNGPAMRAGVLPGDVLVAIEGEALPGGDEAVRDMREMLREAIADGRLDLTVERGGRMLPLSISAERTCAFGLAVQHDQELNAYADGENIMISSRMMEFARDDNQLAVVIGHELAHNFMKHIDAKKQNTAAAGAVGLAADIFFAVLGVNTQGEFTKQTMGLGSQAFSQEFEAEADYAGLYATALGGYDIGVAPDFWRRMGSVARTSIDYGSTHPPTAYRSAALEKIVAEIEAKRRSGQPLRPNIRKVEPPTPEPEVVE